MIQPTCTTVAATYATNRARSRRCTAWCYHEFVWRTRCTIAWVGGRHAEETADRHVADRRIHRHRTAATDRPPHRALRERVAAARDASRERRRAPVHPGRP